MDEEYSKSTEEVNYNFTILRQNERVAASVEKIYTTEYGLDLWLIHIDVLESLLAPKWNRDVPIAKTYKEIVGEINKMPAITMGDKIRIGLNKLRALMYLEHHCGILEELHMEMEII